MNSFFERVKFVKFTDLISFFPFLLALCIYPFYKLKRRHLWLVMERDNEARDNGYWFFKFLREKHPEVDTVYVIHPSSTDYHKVSVLGPTIKPKTLKHWIYYLSAEYNISSQKEGNPNAAACFVLENYLRLNNHRIFLQHGITQNDVQWLMYKISRFKMFACAVEREHEFVKTHLGYPDSVAKLVGFARYDNLLSSNQYKRQILIMPTWREWLGRISSDTTKFETSKRFTDSEYFKVWNSLLNNQRLAQLLNENYCTVIFYPHANMQKHLSDFETHSKNIILASGNQYDVQQLLMESAALITDYSSIFFDFAYMNKPMAYYQFDYNRFRSGHYKEGYFSYENDGFGPVVYNENDLLQQIEQFIKSEFSNKPLYTDRVKKFFTFRDTKNCERTFNAILNLSIK